MTRLSERMLIAAQTNDAVRDVICSILDRVRIVDLTDQEAEVIGTQVPRSDQGEQHTQRPLCYQTKVGPKDDGYRGQQKLDKETIKRFNTESIDQLLND